MGTPQMALPSDDPRIIAWEAYKKTEDFENAKKWAAYKEHVDGSLWTLFIAGWRAREELKSDATTVGHRFPSQVSP